MLFKIISWSVKLLRLPTLTSGRHPNYQPISLSYSGCMHAAMVNVDTDKWLTHMHYGSLFKLLFKSKTTHDSFLGSAVSIIISL